MGPCSRRVTTRATNDLNHACLASLTSFFGVARAIAWRHGAAVLVPQELRACTGRASAHFYCLEERRSPGHRHASDSAFFRAPPVTCRVCPSAFWRRSAGWRASGRCYDDEFFRASYSSHACRSYAKSPGMGISDCRESLSAGVSSTGFCNAGLRDFVCVTVRAIAGPSLLTNS